MRLLQRRKSHRYLLATPLALMATLSAMGCDNNPTEPLLPLRYEVTVSGETFTVEVATQTQAQAMAARMASGEVGVINGTLLAGDGGFNAPWSWRLDPATVEVVDAAIELCDGRPSMVEADLDYWIDVVGRFCPWGAAVVDTAP